jgi:glycosyltransferase involved in cell wall biosynthesis
MKIAPADFSLENKPQCEPDKNARSPMLSFVVPVYGSPESLQPLYERVQSVCATMGLSYELVLVDDCCPRNSWATVKQLAEIDPAVIGIHLSRNFGQHAAIQAGLTLAKGEWIVVMDCDLQDRPEEVPALLAKARQGFEVVRAQRVARNDPWYRRVASKMFYALLSFLTDTRQSPAIGNFGIYSRRVITEILSWQESSKYFPAIVPWIGFAQTELSVSHAPRFAGRSSYNLRKLVRLALDVIIGFSDKPLKLLMAVGLAMAGLSFCVSFVVLLFYFAGLVTVEGWTSIALSLWFLSGCMLFALGLTGLYIGRILVETKGRPSFIIESTVSQVTSIQQCIVKPPKS